MSPGRTSRALILATVLGGGSALGCGTTGQAWVHESPAAPWHGSESSEEYLAENKDDAKQTQPPPVVEEPAPFVPRPVITLGANDMVTDESGRVVPDDRRQERFSSSATNGGAYRGYGYGYGYRGGYGSYRGSYVPYPGSGGVRPVDRPSRSTPSVGGDWGRVPDYGPRMMDKTSPAPTWR